MNREKYKIKGFTLSETIITLVIIGVIVAISLPVLFERHSEREKIAKVKKIYSTLSNAMTFVKSENGDLVSEIGDDNIVDLRNWFDSYIKPRLITTKVCYNESGCWTTDAVKLLNGTISPYSNPGVGFGHTVISTVLNDGTLLSIDPLASGNIWYYYRVRVNTGDNTSAGIVLTFDINGERKPNTIGKDIFVTVFTPKGFVPAYRDATKEEIGLNCTKSGNGFSCLQQYLMKS